MTFFPIAKGVLHDFPQKKSRTVWNLKTSEGDNLQTTDLIKQKIHILLPAWKGQAILIESIPPHSK